MKRRDDSWIDAVEAVLKASTGDLRALAKIAGEDAATLFIGTSMDGTDLRGQDLRGIRFTHLDPSRVKKDHATFLDVASTVVHRTDELPPSDFGEASILVFTRSERVYRELKNRDGTRLTRATLYAPDDEEAFRRDLEVFPGPKVSIIDYTEFEELRLENYARPTVQLIAMPSDRARLRRVRDMVAYSDVARVVVVPLTAEGDAPGRPILMGPVFDLISILTDNWPLLLDELLPPVSIFLRARGTGYRPDVDTWGRLFARITREEMLGFRGVRLRWPTQVSVFEGNVDAGAVLLPHYDEAVVVSFGKSLKDATGAVLIDIDGPAVADSSVQYFESAIKLLRANAWSMTTVNRRTSTPTVEVAGDFGPFHVVIDANGLQSLQKPLVPQGPLTVAFDPIRTLILNDDVTTDEIVDGLLAYNTLWVTMRDLGNFEAGTGSIWWLLASQMTRIARSGSTRARTRYFGLILRSLFKNAELDRQTATALAGALDHPEFERDFIISCPAPRFPIDGFDFDLQIRPRRKFVQDPHPGVALRLIMDVTGGSLLLPRR